MTKAHVNADRVSFAPTHTPHHLIAAIRQREFDMSQDRRERTIRWDDPLAVAGEGLATAGRDYLAAMRRGGLPLPPICHLLGFSISQFEEGRITMRLLPGEHHYNPRGVLHCGVAATLLDSAMGCTVHSTLPAGHA
jgi:hypothetical protein